MKIEFNDNEYRWTYGKQPRGTGFWWFFFNGHEFSFCGSFSEAKKACRDYVKAVSGSECCGFVTVKVGI